MSLTSMTLTNWVTWTCSTTRTVVTGRTGRKACLARSACSCRWARVDRTHCVCLLIMTDSRWP